MACDKIHGPVGLAACQPQAAFASIEHEEFVLALGRLGLLTAAAGNALLGLKVSEQIKQDVLVFAAGTARSGTVVRASINTNMFHVLLQASVSVEDVSTWSARRISMAAYSL